MLSGRLACTAHKSWTTSGRQAFRHTQTFLPTKCGAHHVEQDTSASTSSPDHKAQHSPAQRRRKGAGTRSGKKGGVLSEELPGEVYPIEIAPPQMPQPTAQRSSEDIIVGEIDSGPDSSEHSDNLDSHMSEEEREAQEIFERKSEVILALASATPATLEPLIREHEAEIDELLLHILFNRIEVAQKFKEGDDVVEGLELLLSRLCTELERKNSTPALRLLDDLLHLMESDVGESEQARMNMATERMQRAFSSQRGLGMDIFAMAEALGSGQLDVVDAEAVEFVMREDFVREVGQLVSESSTRFSQKEMELEKMEVALREGIVQGIYKGDERQKLEQLLSERREKAAEMSLSLRWAEMFYKFAVMTNDMEDAVI